MNTQNLARRAYGQVAAPTRTPRGTEYEVIARITHRLKTGALKGKIGFPALAAALNENRTLWSTLAVEVANPKNPLPADLRARIFFLAEFTLTHTSKVLAGTGSVSTLIEINTAIMRGLRGKGQTS